MQIVRKFVIHKVSTSGFNDIPIEIALGNGPTVQESDSCIFFSRDDLVHYNIQMSLDLVGCVLLCSFKSRELPTVKEGNGPGFTDTDSLESDDLSIISLERRETIFWGPERIPPSNVHKISWKLELRSFVDRSIMYRNPTRSYSSYNFFLELTEEEYEECKSLPATSAFKVCFSIFAKE